MPGERRNISLVSTLTATSARLTNQSQLSHQSSLLLARITLISIVGVDIFAAKRAKASLATRKHSVAAGAM
jgi:hypothetical protein